MARDMSHYKQPFTRCIAAVDRQCSQCEDPISEGTVYFKNKRLEIYCLVCKDYDDNRVEKEYDRG